MRFRLSALSLGEPRSDCRGTPADVVPTVMCTLSFQTDPRGTNPARVTRMVRLLVVAIVLGAATAHADRGLIAEVAAGVSGAHLDWRIDSQGQLHTPIEGQRSTKLNGGNGAGGSVVFGLGFNVNDKLRIGARGRAAAHQMAVDSDSQAAVKTLMIGPSVAISHGALYGGVDVMIGRMSSGDGYGPYTNTLRGATGEVGFQRAIGTGSELRLGVFFSSTWGRSADMGDWSSYQMSQRLVAMGVATTIVWGL